MKKPRLRRPTQDELQYLALAEARAIRNHDHTKGAKTTFLRLAHDQAVRDLVRRRKASWRRRTKPLDDVRPEPAAPDTHYRIALLDLVSFLLAQLSEKNRQALILTYLQGLTHKQAAALQGVARSTIKHHVAKGLAQARKLRTTADGP